MRRFVLAAALLALASCEKPPAPPVANPPPELPKLPELKPTEDFSKDEFLELPDGPATPAWDLHENAHHYYAYVQEAHLIVAVTGGPESGKLTSRTQWKGDGEVIGGGQGRGELAFLASPIAQWNNAKPVPSEELNKVQKFVFLYQMGQDGVFTSFQLKSGQEDPLLDLFFTLPAGEMKPGDRSAREVHLARIPDHLKFHGRQEFSHAGRRKVGRHECVKLLSRVDLEATPPGDGQGRLVGAIAAYFDPKEGKLVRADASLAMAVDVRREMRPADPKAAAFWQLHRVQGETRVTITLKD